MSICVNLCQKIKDFSCILCFLEKAFTEKEKEKIAVYMPKSEYHSGLSGGSDLNFSRHLSSVSLSCIGCLNS